ncbi:hypothetical protein LCGC14_1370050 [marine sediment metagenome]|uniref:Uncharacterized protein n=1 Tax=marine sediment metagenome TaxID=412755 RepID=A0A0F9K618_9ZZZZ
MLTKKVLQRCEIDAMRILVGHLRDVDCHQNPQDIRSDLHNLSDQFYNLTLIGQTNKERKLLKQD